MASRVDAAFSAGSYRPRPPDRSRAAGSLPLALRVAGGTIVSALMLLSGCSPRKPLSPAPPPARPAARPGSSQGFAPALPGYHFRFPRDSGAHPTYKTEWWYYTGHLHAPGSEYGFELTFFRVGLTAHPAARRSRWAASAVYLAHFAITDPQARQFHYTERTDRGALGLAGADVAQENVWIQDWRARVIAPPARRAGDDPRLWLQQIQAAADFGALNLDLAPLKPPVIQGRDGVSVKGPGSGEASHYYSYTRLAASGTLKVGGRVLPVTGLAWMDHEFGSSQLSPDEIGWDWFSVQLDDGWDLMLYRIRQVLPGARSQEPTVSPYSSGSLVSPGGSTVFIPGSAFTAVPLGMCTSPHTGASYPVDWRLQDPTSDLDLRVTPLMPDQELQSAGSTGVTYWEGATHVRGQHASRSVTGQGYTELTGYHGALEQLR